MQETLREQMAQEVEERRKRREEVLDIYGEDDWANATVIRFYKMFGESEGRLYSYVAIKNNGMWYVGGMDVPLNWIDFIDFFENDNRLDAEAIWVATNFSQVYKVE